MKLSTEQREQHGKEDETHCDEGHYHGHCKPPAHQHRRLAHLRGKQDLHRGQDQGEKGKDADKGSGEPADDGPGLPAVGDLVLVAPRELVGSRRVEHEPVELETPEGEIEAREAELAVLVPHRDISVGNTFEVVDEVLELSIRRLRGNQVSLHGQAIVGLVLDEAAVRPQETESCPAVREPPRLLLLLLLRWRWLWMWLWSSDHQVPRPKAVRKQTVGQGLEIDDVPVPHEVQTRLLRDDEAAALKDVTVQRLDVLAALACHVVQVGVERVQETARDFTLEEIVHAFIATGFDKWLVGQVMGRHRRWWWWRRCDFSANGGGGKEEEFVGLLERHGGQ